MSQRRPHLVSHDIHRFDLHNHKFCRALHLDHAKNQLMCVCVCVHMQGIRSIQKVRDKELNTYVSYMLHCLSRSTNMGAFGSCSFLVFWGFFFFFFSGEVEILDYMIICWLDLQMEHGKSSRAYLQRHAFQMYSFWRLMCGLHYANFLLTCIATDG